MLDILSESPSVSKSLSLEFDSLSMREGMTISVGISRAQDS